MSQPVATTPLVAVRGLRKRYGDAEALAGIDLEVQAGEMVSVIGTSGSGKTTLLNVVGGLDRDYQGSVTVAGHDLNRLPDRALSAFRNETIGFVFQHFHLLGHLNCRENVLLPSYFARKTLPARADDVLRRVGLGDKIEAKPANLSGGQKQRVAIARALLHRPRLILCDEPTGNLDRKTGQQILDLFAELNAQEGLTLIVVTHEEHISQAAGREIRLEAGQVVSA